MRVSSACLGPLATNCYLIELDSTTLLVDPADASPGLAAFIGERTIDAVVLTHGHFDHIGGAWAAGEAAVFMHAEDLGLLDEYSPDHGPIDIFLSDGDCVAPGIDVLHLPGHSPGSIALKIEDALFVGDILFAGSIGRTDLPGGSMKMMSESLRRLVDLEGDYDVYPGHGPATTLNCERDTNPYLRMMR